MRGVGMRRSLGGKDENTFSLDNIERSMIDWLIDHYSLPIRNLAAEVFAADGDFVPADCSAVQSETTFGGLPVTVDAFLSLMDCELNTTHFHPTIPPSYYHYHHHHHHHGQRWQCGRCLSK